MSFQYDQYLARHRANVKKGFDWLSENLPGLMTNTLTAGWNIEFAHDQSKNEPDEYEAYDAYFYGNNRSYEVVQRYQRAWLLHIHRNPHHWQHWILIHDDMEDGELETVLEMPYDYIIEMICDWWSFSWQSGNLYEIFKWYEEHSKYIKLAQTTKITVEYILDNMKKKLQALQYADHSLMQRLSNAGTDHRKFMRMLPVYVRITAPLYWWKEFDTYKVGTVANSCSTMHKIQAKEFTMDDFSCEHLMGGYLEQMRRIIDDLNNARKYFTVGDQFFSPGNKRDWWQMIQLLPSSYNQTRNVMMNYEVLANIYKSRKDHKLDEWRNFCKWIEELPYSELITGGKR